jgi:uncharacterized membrane-anchored protein YhcB (DUF1043 family)
MNVAWEHVWLFVITTLIVGVIVGILWLPDELRDDEK